MRRRPPMRHLLCVVVIATVTLCYARSNPTHHAVTAPVSLTTQERMYTSAFWPTNGDSAAGEYAGEATCVSCHADIVSVQHQTPMYHAATPASLLSLQSPLKFQESTFSYTVQQTKSDILFSVDSVSGSGPRTDSRAVAWAFGDGQTGQTYLLRQRDGYIESRLSYYTALKALDNTVGHSGQPPSSPEDAFGHELTFDTAQRCFACHTTASTLSNVFIPDRSVPGVTCEACHGPGAAHVAAAKSGRRRQTIASITNPASMSPADSVDFCGACHRTFSDVAVFMPSNLGAISVRFQPYSLEKSRCWGRAGDARITCIACHDPHRPLVRESAAYDHNCLACHNSGLAQQAQNHLPGSSTPGSSNSISSTSGASTTLIPSAPACKVATKNCVTCHMPKVEVPQTHASFTDHQIRIVQASIP